jgi:hypothetical protein
MEIRVVKDTNARAEHAMVVDVLSNHAIQTPNVRVEVVLFEVLSIETSSAQV